MNRCHTSGTDVSLMEACTRREEDIGDLLEDIKDLLSEIAPIVRDIDVLASSLKDVLGDTRPETPTQKKTSTASSTSRQ